MATIRTKIDHHQGPRLVFQAPVMFNGEKISPAKKKLLEKIVWKELKRPLKTVRQRTGRRPSRKIAVKDLKEDPAKAIRIRNLVEFNFFIGDKTWRFLVPVRALPLKEHTAHYVIKPIRRVEKGVFQRVLTNPILKPSRENRWESNAVFNTAAIYLENRFHFIYRAIGDSGLSVFGYASSSNGTDIETRSSEPVFVSDQIPTGKKEYTPYPYASGGSSWGSEDPRITRVEDTIYMTYTAFNGHNPPCVALTSIGVEEFLRKKWDWSQPKIISQPGITNKNWVVFPEKINGAFALLNSITPQISIAYLESLDFENGIFVPSQYRSHGREEYWDNWVRGVGPPPIKTEAGWLVLYHAMDKNDPDKYKIGAMILDEKEPGKILFRSNSPMLEPRHWYENDGHKRGVVYSCGATVVKDKLYIYYGGSDNFICAATAELNVLLDELKLTPVQKPIHH